MISYSPIHPRHPVEAIVLVFAAYLWSFQDMPYFAFAVAFSNYIFWITRYRHEISYHAASNTNTQQPTHTIKMTDAEETMQTLMDDRGHPARVIGSMDSHRRIVFDLQLPRSFSVKKLTSDVADIQRAYGVKPINIEPTVAGKPGVSRIMLPKKGTPDPIRLTDIIETDDYKAQHPLSLPLGMGLDGSYEYRRLDQLPHVIIAGTTGSGKSVEVNTWIISLMLKNTPDELQLVMIDPKRLEFAVYENAPHLAMPVITEMSDALLSAQKTVNEMEYRYKCMQTAKVRDLNSYNKVVTNKRISNPLSGETEQFSNSTKYLEAFPRIVVVIDEMSDLMMTYKEEIEDPIARLAQKARACGIHLILATQRPEVKVITGLIKANVAARFSMQVATDTDSRIILDRSGAQNLLGRGDGLFAASQSDDLLNVQGFFIDEEEIEQIIENL